MNYRNFISIYQFSYKESKWKNRGKNYLTEVMLNTPYGIFFTGFSNEEYALFCVRFVSCDRALRYFAVDKEFLCSFYLVGYAINPHTTYMLLKVRGSLKIVLSQEPFFCKEGHELPVHFVKLHVTPRHFADLNHTYRIRPNKFVNYFQTSKITQRGYFDYYRPIIMFLERSKRSCDYIVCQCKTLENQLPRMEIENTPEYVPADQKELYRGEDKNFIFESRNETLGFNSVVYREYNKEEFKDFVQKVDFTQKVHIYCGKQTRRISEPL